MRDAARIARMLALLEYLWRRYPDLRLAQLVVNLTGQRAPEVFYFEDDKLEAALNEWLNNPPPGLDEARFA